MRSATVSQVAKSASLGPSLRNSTSSRAAAPASAAAACSSGARSRVLNRREGNRIRACGQHLQRRTHGGELGDLAHEVARAGGRVELKRGREIYRAALGPADGDMVSPVSMAAFLAASYLERIGDIAVDLAEQTVIVVNGLFREVDDVPAPQPAPASV